MATQSKLFASIFILLIGGVIGYYMPTPEVDIEVAWRTADDNRYRPSYSLQGGEEIAFIFIGASSCAAANGDRITTIVRSAKKAIDMYADSVGLSYRTIGVSRDWSAQEGAKYLDKFGKFHEISSGGNWLNIGVIKYVYDELSGKGATPQLLLVQRQVKGREAPTYSIENERLLLRKVGMREISQWQAAGYPVPQL